MEVQRAGGGIHFTVSRTQQATEEELLQSLLDRLGRMLRAGESTDSYISSLIIR